MGKPRHQPRERAASHETHVTRPALVDKAAIRKDPGLILGLAATVALLVALVHWPALSARAISFDDPEYVTQNPFVLNPGWDSAWKFLSEVSNPSTVRGYYQPLNMISLMLDAAMGGSPTNLRVFHRTSLILHSANAVLVFLLLWLLFDQVWVAACVALLFGAHPLTVETIPWLGERKTLLAAFFSLGSLNFYVWYTKHGPRWAYAACLATYLLALLSKPTSTPLPVAMLLMDIWPLARWRMRCIVEKIPHFSLAAVFSVITYVSQAAGAGVSLPGQQGSAGRSILVLCHNIVFYLWKIVWPANLCSHYGFPEPMTLAHPMVLAGLIGTILLGALLLFSLRYTRAFLLGWLIFFVLILPALQLIGFSQVIASDKFAYLPSIGLLMLLAWGLTKLLMRASVARVRPVTGGLVALALVIVAFQARTARAYLYQWQESERFYQYMLAKVPRGANVHFIYGVYLAQQGRNDEAITKFRTAVELEPMLFEAKYNLGYMLYNAGRSEEAIPYFTSVPPYCPEYADAALHLGYIAAAKGQLDLAIELFRAATVSKPDHPDAHFNLGCALTQKREFAAAEAEFRKVLSLTPDDAEARAWLEKVVGSR